jgi:hypothetical protein
MNCGANGLANPPRRVIGNHLLRILRVFAFNIGYGFAALRRFVAWDFGMVLPGCLTRKDA